MSSNASRTFTFGTRAALVLVAVLAGLELWAESARDPDFYLPDPFRPLGLLAIGVFVATGFVRHARTRRAIRTLTGVLVVAVLCLEVMHRARDVGDSRVELTEDVLLRYRYRPGARMSRPGGGEEAVGINHLGLWDREYAVPKPPDVYRIVVLTGSIANDGSIPFDDRFHEVLERELADLRPGGRRIEVINASCDGWNTTQQVRFLERVASAYEPDFVVLAYMLTSASIQNGAYRRLGNSFFAFRFLPLVAAVESGSRCSVFAPLHEAYTFDLVVRNAMERLALLRERDHFRTLVAVLPILEAFDDPVCTGIYDHVVDVARASGHETIRVADAFAGEDFRDFEKPDERMDLCHPNASGHARIAEALEASIRQALAEEAAVPSERPAESPASPGE